MTMVSSFKGSFGLSWLRRPMADRGAGSGEAGRKPEASAASLQSGCAEGPRGPGSLPPDFCHTLSRYLEEYTPKEFFFECTA